MNIENLLALQTAKAMASLFQQEIAPENIMFQKTRKEFDGDLTLVVFPFTKFSKSTPEATATQLGDYLKSHADEVSGFNVVKGFLNLQITSTCWLEFFRETAKDAAFGFAKTPSDRTVMVEYSSPNTNKPLHLGHIRNNLLGYSVAEVLKANGHKVIKTNLVNDRGIHICKSMLAWKKWGQGETPETTGIKGDHVVGKYYVTFDKHYKTEVAGLIADGLNKEEAEKKAPLILEAQEMLQKWESGDQEIMGLWKTMNGWVYKGFAETYQMLGVDFDKVYYESETYLLGKSIVEEGLGKGVFFKKEDGSVWVDLTVDGLDQKLLLRADGTSVYMTQDLGTAVERANEYHFNDLVYVVGNEQDYHFKVLKLILKKLGYDWAGGLYHLSYGMVELPEGKMKSREGTVVDADDLVKGMIQTAKETTLELGKIEGFTNEEAEKLYKTIGLGALKYFILKVDPRKKMLFDPKESIDFNGNTGPFIQYTYARIQSILRKAGENKIELAADLTINPKEKEVIRLLYDFPGAVKEAGDNYSPALIANYVYELAKVYNQFYHDCPILKEENETVKNFRIQLCQVSGQVIESSMKLLGIEVPDRM